MTEREEFLQQVFDNGNDKEYGLVSAAFQIANSEIDALRKELDAAKARMLKVEEDNSILSEELEATEGALKLSAAKYKSDAGIQQFANVKAQEMISELRKELEFQKNQNNFDATRLMRLCNFCGVSMPESQEEQLQVAGVLVGSCLRELELKFSKLSQELEQVLKLQEDLKVVAK